MIAKEKLSKILESNQIPHALLFSGPKGTGKSQAAYKFVLSLLKTQKKLENHPDIHQLFPEGKTDMHPISAIRSLCQDAALVPYEANCKVFIIHDAEKMLPTSSNALLKTLEEPPAHTVIILLSSHPDRLLPTLFSRCQTIEFPTPQQKNIDPATLALLLNPEKITQFETPNPESVFETLMLWHRDRHLLEFEDCSHLLSFPDHLSELKKTPLIPLEEITKIVTKIRLAHERSTKLSTCLEMFFQYTS